MSQYTTSEGTTFAQRGGDSNKQLPTYDKKYWENMQCFICLQKGHPGSHCTKNIINTNKSDDDKFKSSKSSKSTNTSKAAGLKKLCNSQIKIKKSFTTLNTIIEEMENEDSEFTDSDDDDEEKSHFQFEEKD